MEKSKVEIAEFIGMDKKISHKDFEDFLIQSIYENYFIRGNKIYKNRISR